VTDNELVVRESGRRHKSYVVVRQVRANVPELQIIAAYCQERVPPVLGK
jgi:hypothetical protein